MDNFKSGRGGERAGAGRPATGRKERITVNIEAGNLEWLKAQKSSYSRVINGLIGKEIEMGSNSTVWTEEKPKAGWYWFRDPEIGKPSIVFVKEGDIVQDGFQWAKVIEPVD